MVERKLYIDRYEKIADHLIAGASEEIHSLYLNEVKICLRDAKQSKDKIAIKSYLDHVDFILKDVFGIKVVLP